MPTQDDLRKLMDEAIKTANTDSLEKTAAALQSLVLAEKTTLESEKLKLETEQLKRVAPRESWRFWMPAMAPFVGVSLVAVTLYFQLHQFNTNYQLQVASADRQAVVDEDAKFREAMATAKMPESVSAFASMSLLKGLLNSKTHSAEANEVAVSLLGMTAPIEGYAVLFPAVFGKPSWDKFGEAVRLAQIINRRWDDDLFQQKALKRELLFLQRQQASQPRNSPPVPQFLMPQGSNPTELEGKLHELEFAIRDVQMQASLVAKYVADCLRTSRPPNTAVNLSDAVLFNADLSGIDLGDADLKGTDLISIDISGADLSKVNEFGNSGWNGTAWWRAKRISLSLLNSLGKNSPFDPKDDYFKDTTRTRSEYLKEVGRLNSLIQ
jgi:pentapeptide repeat protein